jgi:hypothetical protein
MGAISLGQVRGWLDRRLYGADSVANDLESILEEFVSQWPVTDLLNTFVNNSDELNALGARTYRHDNGFDRIELFSSMGKYGLRLHIWWGDVGAKRERVHSHPWDFASKVLTGLLEFEQFVESRLGEEVDAFEYAEPDGGDTYKLAPGGTARLRRIMRMALPAGASYCADHQLLHRVWTAPGQTTATLMLHGRGIAYPSRVFVEKRDPREPETEHRREHPTVESLLLKLRRIEVALASKWPSKLSSLEGLLG